MPIEIYKNIISPILDRRDSETWHSRTREALHIAESTPFTLKLLEQFADKRHRFTDEKLNVVVGGIEFDNPVMAGAGWDKAGEAVRSLYQLGFSGVEVGSVLQYPQPGNDKPRQFILAPGVALNRLGFNTPGMEAVNRNLERYKENAVPIGINIGKNNEVKPENAPLAYAAVAEYLYDHASYFAINVSCPNAPGLRALQDKSFLTDIVQAVNEAMDKKGGRKPLFVKISPDLDNEAVNNIIEVVADNALTGIIATNSTVRPDLKALYGKRWENEAGGLSGNNEVFRKMATEKIAHIYRETGGQMEIIGIGGIKDTQTALEKIKAGAKMVQIITAMRGEGPSVPGRINRGLVDYMNKEKIKDINELIGSDHPNRIT